MRITTSKNTIKVKKVRLKSVPPTFDHDLPATFGMLDAVRGELKADIRRLDKKIDTRFANLDAKFSGIDEKFSGVEGRFSSLDVKFAKIDERFSGLEGQIAGLDSRVQFMQLMFESQNAKTNTVLDHLNALFNRQERVENQVQKHEDFFLNLPRK